MFERILDKLMEAVQFFMFWVVIRDYERAVVLRFGRYHRTLKPGFHWVWPLGIEDALHDNIVPRTVSLSAQSLTTRDNKQIVVSAVVTASISDIKKALLKVEGVDHALMDACYAAIAQSVSRADWSTLATEEFGEALTEACRLQAGQYGVEIERVQLADLSMCKSIRLHATNHYSAPLGES